MGGGGRKPSPEAPLNKCTYMATCFTVPRHALTPPKSLVSSQPCHRVPIYCKSLSLFLVTGALFFIKKNSFFDGLN